MNANELAEELDKTGWTARFTNWELLDDCLLYTSDAADE